MARRKSGWKNRNRSGNSPEYESMRHGQSAKGIKTGSFVETRLQDTGHTSITDPIILDTLDAELGEIKEKEIKNFENEYKLDQIIADKLVQTRKDIADAELKLELLRKNKRIDRDKVRAKIRAIRADKNLTRLEKREKIRILANQYKTHWHEEKQKAIADRDRSKMLLIELQKAKAIEESRDKKEIEFHQLRNKFMQRQGEIEKLQQRIDKLKASRGTGHAVRRHIELIKRDIAKLKSEQESDEIELEAKVQDLELDKEERIQGVRSQRVGDKISIMDARQKLEFDAEEQRARRQEQKLREMEIKEGFALQRAELEARERERPGLIRQFVAGKLVTPPNIKEIRERAKVRERELKLRKELEPEKELPKEPEPIEAEKERKKRKKKRIPRKKKKKEIEAKEDKKVEEAEVKTF